MLTRRNSVDQSSVQAMSKALCEESSRIEFDRVQAKARPVACQWPTPLPLPRTKLNGFARIV